MSPTENMLCRKTNLSVFQKVGLMENKLSDHNGIKPETNTEKVTRILSNVRK